MTRPGQELKAAETRAKSARVRSFELARAKKQWVDGTEMTPEQLEESLRALKRDFYERQARRAA